MASDGPMNTLPATRSGRCAISHSAHWEAIDSDTGTACSVPVASSTARAARPWASHWYGAGSSGRSERPLPGPS
jgi:hypothetical protein